MVKLNSFLSYIRAIGIGPTMHYIIQRYITRKVMIVIRLPGIKQPIYLRRNSKDINVFQQIFIKRDLNFLKWRDFKTCIDAGANIGLSTIFMKQICPDATIYSIEPEPANIEMLKLNTSGYTGIIVIPKALGENGEGLFLYDPGEGADSFRTVKRNTGDLPLFKLESICVTDILNQYNIAQLDFIKIDIEGAEDFCITQAAMSWISKVKVLAVEIHDHLVPGCSGRIKILLIDNFKYFKNGEYSIFENLDRE